MKRLILVSAVLLAAIPATIMVMVMSVGVCAGATWRILQDVWQQGGREQE